MIDLARKTKTRITFVGRNNCDAVWRPDGKSIVFSSSPEGSTHIYRIAADGTCREEKVLMETPGMSESAGCVSADGRYLGYVLLNLNEHGKRGYGAWALPMFGDRKPFPLVSTPLLPLRGITVERVAFSRLVLRARSFSLASGGRGDESERKRAEGCTTLDICRNYGQSFLIVSRGWTACPPLSVT